jgi:hypothetical protein
MAGMAFWMAATPLAMRHLDTDPHRPARWWNHGVTESGRAWLDLGGRPKALRNQVGQANHKAVRLADYAERRGVAVSQLLAGELVHVPALLAGRAHVAGVAGRPGNTAGP